MLVAYDIRKILKTPVRLIVIFGCLHDIGLVDLESRYKFLKLFICPVGESVVATADSTLVL